MGIYRHQRFIMITCICSLCLLPLLSACVATMHEPDMEIQTIVITDKNENEIHDLNEIGDYTIHVAQGEGNLQLYYRCKDELVPVLYEWNEEQKQWDAEVSFTQTGSYQIVAQWFQEEELIYEWESEVYQFIDTEALLKKAVTENSSLFLQLEQVEGISVSVLLVDTAQNEHVISEEQLYEGYRFEKEGTWDLTLTVQNETGSELTKHYEHLLEIDHTIPQLSIKSEDYDLIKDSLPLQAQPVLLKLSASDMHLDADSLSVMINGKVQKAVWKQDENTYTTSILLEKDGAYIVQLSASDRLGNEAKVQTATIEIDQSAPQLSIQSEDCDLIKDSLPLQAQPVLLRLSASDVHLDADSLSVMINGKVQKAVWKQDENTYTTLILLEKDGAYIIQLSASDRLGNEAKVQTTTIEIDQSAPQLHLYMDNQAINELPDYLNHEVSFRCVVNDPHFDPKNSVLKDGDQVYDSWQKKADSWVLELVLKDGAHQLFVHAQDEVKHHVQRKVDTIVDSISPLVFMHYEVLNTYRDDVVVSFLIQDANFQPDDAMIQLFLNDQKIEPNITWKQTAEGLQASFVSESEGMYQLKLQLYDSADNQAVYRQNGKQADHYEHTYLLDKTAPQMRVTYDKEKMSADHQLMRIQIVDKFIDAQQIKLEVTKDQQPYRVKIPWQVSSGTVSGDVKFDEAGFYEISLSAVDRAGNVSKQITDHFIIDQQAPMINIQRSQSQLFLNQPLDVSIAVHDEYLAAYEISVLKDGQPFQTNQGTASVEKKLHFNADGDYEIVVSGIDRAGNHREQRDHLILDQTAPKLTAFFGEMPAQNHQRLITNRDTLFTLAWEDRYLKNESVVIHKNGKPIATVVQNQRFTYEIKAEKDHEDLYEIAVSFTDEAGNHIEANYELMVDTYLPQLRFHEDPFQGKAKNITWIPKLEMENEAFQISEVLLYRNQQAVPSYRWGEAISEDGHYLLSVQIRDDAMNEATLLPPFAFTIDTLPPVIEIIEAERKEALSDQNVSLDTELRLYISDALSADLNIHTLMLGDENLLEKERQQDENGLWYYPISFGKEGDISLLIDVSDEAENRTKQQFTYHVLPHLTKEQVKTIEKKTPTVTREATDDQHSVWILGAMASLLLVMVAGRLYAEKQ